MRPKKQFSTEVGGKTLTLEVSSLAEQSNAAVLAKFGDTVALITVVMSIEDTSANYMPLRVDYEERFYAAGKIIGSRFVRREARPSEDAILTGRVVDRSIRPLFDQRIRRDIQVVVTVLSYDEENDPDFVGLIGASTALGISDIPWGGPVGAVRLAKIGDKFVVNPPNSAVNKPEYVYDSFVAGTKDTISMIELGGKEAEEDDVGKGFALAQSEINKLIAFQESVIKEIGKPKQEVKLAEPDEELKKEILSFIGPRLEDAVFHPLKTEQQHRLSNLRYELFEHLRHKFIEGEPKREVNFKAADFLFEDAINDLVHKEALTKERRPDGRKLDEVRALDGEVGLFNRTHGSALFVRGSTQALAVVTLAPPGAEQLIETMETTGKRHFMLHYNFPPYSVGEIGVFRGPGRREIGHGALASKALQPLIPTIEEFPYTIRVVSEIMSSNGSSSMATACAGTLALLDAGVPLKKPVAGIAMGMMSDGNSNYKILTDIQGPEDHHGDMDFKVAGTRDGITAIQLDVKINGLRMEMVKKTLAQARAARIHILDFMKTVLESPRPKISSFAPLVQLLRINPEKIGLVIGPGGKTINGFIRDYEILGIDIEEDGRVYVSGNDHAKVERVVNEIKNMTREFRVGDIIEGQVINIMDFGAIVDLGGGQDGMIHVSELKNGYVKSVTDVLRKGDFVRAKVIRAEDGRIGLSLKQMEQ